MMLEDDDLKEALGRATSGQGCSTQLIRHMVQQSKAQAMSEEWPPVGVYFSPGMTEAEQRAFLFKHADELEKGLLGLKEVEP